MLGIHAVRVRMQQVGKHSVGLGLFTLRLDAFAAFFRQGRPDVVSDGFLKVGANSVFATVLASRFCVLATKSYMPRSGTSSDGFRSVRLFPVLKVFHVV